MDKHDMKYSQNKSPCGDCGKWKNGCRKTCDKWTKFEQDKNKRYEETLNERRSADEYFGYRSQKKPKTSSTAVSRYCRKKGSD